MPSPGGHSDAPRAGGRPFVTTRWSIVLAAGHGSRPGSQAALAKLCETYWYPLYCYICRHGRTPEEAEDLTQGFFASLLERDWLRAADPHRGRFRSFLLASLNHFLANQWDRARARKRGGGRKMIPIHSQEAESRYSLEPADLLTPEKLFERQWALTLLDQVLGELRRQCAREGKERIFGQLKEFLGGAAGDVPYSQAASTLGMSEGAVKMAVHRLRRHYRRLLRAHIAQTVASPEDIDHEVRHLFEALQSG